jgi:hypothetical protein
LANFGLEAAFFLSPAFLEDAGNLNQPGEPLV